MCRPETEDCAGPGLAPSEAEPDGYEASRALVVVQARNERGNADRGPRHVGGRPLAGFVTQLIVSTDPAARPSRITRTKAAAALYAQTADRTGSRRRRA